MQIALYLPILLIIAGLLIYLIVLSMKKIQSGVKIMLLGMQLTLVGGIIVIDSNIGLSGLEYLIILVGLILSVVGMSKNT